MSGNIVRVPSTAVLRKHHSRVEAMMRDRNLGGDLLLVAFAFAYLVDFTPKDCWRIDKAAEYLHPYPPHAHGPAARFAASAKVAKVVAADRRRYEGPPPSANCVAPVRGRDTMCGRKAAAHGATIIDLDDGTHLNMAVCGRHVTWLKALAKRNRALCRRTLPPQPFANTGGVLRRHLPELNWPALWRGVDAGWQPAREGDAPAATPGEKPAGRPQLRVLPGGGFARTDWPTPDLRLVVTDGA